ncbi:hypothetical protein [Priestia megaterium]|uniref:hypothetical protein n=1 Tax=Priestia megaterium TaxID=1404 RepID=UPI000471BBB6|nr:hypothetical protein [Priestia megaterium]
MSWEDRDNNYSYDGGMLGDSSQRRNKPYKPKIPKFKPIVKKKVPSTDFGEAMSGLIIGMLLIFPAIALLTISAPLVIFSIIGIITLITWASTQDGKFALIILGVCLAPVILGFISLGFYMMIFGR